MPSTRYAARRAIVAILVTSIGAPAATDVPIPAKSVAVTPGRRLVTFTARRRPIAPATFPLPAPGSAEDPTGGGAILHVFDREPGAGSLAVRLEAAGWTGLGNPAGFRGYRYRGLTTGCKALLQRDVIKLRCRGAAVTLHPPFAGSAGIVLGLPADAQSLRYCAELAGDERKNDAARLKRRRAPAPAACAEPPVPVTIDPGIATGALDERYVGYSLDWQKPNDGLWPDETPALESPKLRRLVSQLAPSRFRIGGTDSNAAYFCEDDACVPPQTYQDAFRDPDDLVPTFTREDVARAADFAAAVDSTVMFALNVGPGPRDPDTGVWQDGNTRALMEYVSTVPDGDRFDIWEAGNEFNVIGGTFRMPVAPNPALYAETLGALRGLIDDASPGARLAGPSAFFLPFAGSADLGFTAAVVPLARDVLDVVTWHLYATQSQRCLAAVSPFPASKGNLFDETAIAMNRGFARSVLAAADGLPVLNGESASVQCGGQLGISDTMLDALWFADWIGIMVEEGTRSIVRQTLVGREYALLTQPGFDPHPTFLVYVMFRRTVAGFRLGTTADRGRVKTHAFCAPGGTGAMTVVLSNPSDAPVDAELALAGGRIVGAAQWTVDAAGSFTATAGAINGEAALADGTIPDPAGTPVVVTGGRAYPRVPPNAAGFVVVEPEDGGGVCGAP